MVSKLAPLIFSGLLGTFATVLGLYIGSDLTAEREVNSYRRLKLEEFGHEVVALQEQIEEYVNNCLSGGITSRADSQELDKTIRRLRASAILLGSNINKRFYSYDDKLFASRQYLNNCDDSYYAEFKGYRDDLNIEYRMLIRYISNEIYK